MLRPAQTHLRTVPETDIDLSEYRFSESRSEVPLPARLVVTESARLMLDALGVSPLIVAERTMESVDHIKFALAVVELPCAVRVCCLAQDGHSLVCLLDEPLGQHVLRHVWNGQEL